MIITTSFRKHRIRRAWLFAAATALLVGLGFVVPAAAVAPMALTDQITDRVGAVEGSTSEIRAALDDLEGESGIRMWVVFVDTFDGIPAQRWADGTFHATGLGADDFLLAVAVNDREYGYVVASEFVLSDAALVRVADAAEQHLAENPTRAVVAAADAMVDQITRLPEEEGGTPAWLILGIVGTALAAFIGNGYRRVRKGLPFSAPSSGVGYHTWPDRGNPPDRGGGGTRGGGGGGRGGSGSF